MSKARLFYGWWVLLGIFISYAAVGVQVYTLPLFYPELKSEFGWSEESITLAATIFYLTGAILTPILTGLNRKRVILPRMGGRIIRSCPPTMNRHRCRLDYLEE